MDLENEETEYRILLLGLDNAGKTTILYRFKFNETVTPTPTLGFNIETISPYRGLKFTIWDAGGEYKIRSLWRHYYQNTNGLFYVVDSADIERIKESCEELHGILEDSEMHGKPVVIMANKQDLPNALSCSELVNRLKLNKLSLIGNKWHIHLCCASNGEGVFESMKEMADMLHQEIR